MKYPESVKLITLLFITEYNAIVSKALLRASVTSFN